MKNLNENIKELEKSIQQIIASDDELRKCEGRNLLQVVWQTREDLNEYGFTAEIDEILHTVGSRVQALLENPEARGRHELLETTKPNQY